MHESDIIKYLMQNPDLKYVKSPSKILIIKVKTNNNKKNIFTFWKKLSSCSAFINSISISSL